MATWLRQDGKDGVFITEELDRETEYYYSLRRNYAVLRAALRRGCYVNVARVVRGVRAQIKKTELKRCCKFVRATGFTATWTEIERLLSHDS